MSLSRLIQALTLSLLITGPTFAADDRLGVQGPIDFDGTQFGLASVIQPQSGYTKQEYLPDGEGLDAWRSMILVELLEGDMTVADVARSQIEMLADRRSTDPYVNYDIFISDDESSIVLDFLLSGSSDTGEAIVEWNGYRYTRAEGDGVTAGVWLVGISRRAYGDDITPFIAQLDQTRTADVESLVGLTGVPPDE